MGVHVRLREGRLKAWVPNTGRPDKVQPLQGVFGIEGPPWNSTWGSFQTRSYAWCESEYALQSH